MMDIVITNDFCYESSIMRKFKNREFVTPYTVGCYIYQAVTQLNIPIEDVVNKVLTKWDSLYWGDSQIGINTWNRLFSGKEMSKDEWEKISFPWRYIRIVKQEHSSLDYKILFYPSGERVALFLAPVTEALYLCDQVISVAPYARGTVDVVCKELLRDVTQVSFPSNLK